MTPVRLPERWRSDRLLLSDATTYRVREAEGDDRALLLVGGGRRAGITLVGRGDPAGVRALLEDRRSDGRLAAARWMSVPHGTDPSPDVLHTVGLTRFSSWDWLVTTTAPAAVVGPQVDELDPVADEAAIRACLAVANPTSSADPTDAAEAAWFGIRDERLGGPLLGVVGASTRGGPGEDVPSWHVHGLGVRPDARTAGIGTTLTAAATRAGLERGAAWVSLGIYAENHAARRIYERLGFVTYASFDSFGPDDATRRPG